ncbi:DNA-protecting protein DprA [Nakamurella sp. YIM 132087]|uniref:DNA-protecting protein DprA n=1 Tax=Nakamurella alba TaxID=2665158 RepID=A0A7K1FRC1_9ACTN|nr:DNA-processing protein DprA [Nakamurella alba]MTD16685.1 DNA-protecting protein DprA [Nakamurella alba]
MSTTDVDDLPGTGAAAPIAVRIARAGLLRACEPSARGVAALVELVGPVRAWHAVRSRTATAGLPVEWMAETDARTAGLTPGQLDDTARADLATAGRVGARLVVPEDEEWPAAALHGLWQVDRIADRTTAPPVALYVRGGSIGDLPHTGITVVGSRAATAYGQRVAADLGHALADAGLTVVSGAAFGIDASAHRAAMAAQAQLPTLAVLACGIDRAYPAANAALIERIGELGAVVTEYPPGTHPSRLRFLVRNRLIAALGAATIVVEAGIRSGTLSTAGAAEKLHRPLMVVPGPVTSALSVGCHRLLQEPGRHLVTGPADVLEILRPVEHLGDQGHLFETPTAPADDDLGPSVKAVSDALSVRLARTVPEIARDTGLPTRDALDALAVLEASGLASRTGTGWRRSPRTRTRRSQ